MVLATAVALASLFLTSGGSPRYAPPPTTSGTAATSAPTSGASSGEGGAASLPPNPSAGSIRWRGSVTIPNGGGDGGFLDMDQLPPADTTAGYLAWFVGAGGCATSSCIYDSGLDVSMWTGSRPPDYSQCQESAQTHGLGVQYVPAQTSTELCLITAAGHTAFLQVTGIDTSTNTASANVTIWTG